MGYNYPCILIDESDPNSLKPIWFVDKDKLTGEKVLCEEDNIIWKDDSMDKNTSPGGKLWITTHRFVFQMFSKKSSPEGLFEVPFEIFVKESYTGGFFQSGHRVKIKRDGSKQPNVYDSNTLNVMIQNISAIKAEELKLESSDIEQQYKMMYGQRVLPNKVTLFCPSKSTRNKIKKHIDDVVSRQEWTKVKFDINQHIRKSDIGIGNIMGRQKERDNVISTKIAMTFGDNSAAHELVEIANDIKRRLARFKDSFPNYQENAEIMNMIFELGMNNDQDEVFVQESMAGLSKKDFKNKLVEDLVEFLDENIKSYGGWIPCAELYCKFNRKMGLEVISPEEFTTACSGLSKFQSSNGGYYIHERTFALKNGDT